MEEALELEPPLEARAQVHFELLEYSRSPKNFLEAFFVSAELQECRQNLLDNGFPTTLGFGVGAKLFCLPSEAETIIDHIREAELVFDVDNGNHTHVNFAGLKPRHIVCSAEFREAIDRAVENRPNRKGRDNIRLKRSLQIVAFA